MYIYVYRTMQTMIIIEHMINMFLFVAFNFGEKN